MADIRINSLPSTATSFNTDDYIAIDGASGGTRKMLAATLPLTDVTLGGSSGPSVKSTLSARAPRQGLVFDGTAGATVSVPAFGTADFSCAGWFYATNNTVYLLSASTGGAAIFIAPSGVLSIAKEGSATITSSSSSVTDGKWRHFVWTRSGTAEKLYINGILDASATDGSTLDFNQPIIRVGSQFNGNLPVNGAVVPFIYNRALSASEVVALYEAGAPSGADYNSASNTSAITGAWTKASGSGTVTSTAVDNIVISASGNLTAISAQTISVSKGQKVRLAGSWTGLSGTINCYLYTTGLASNVASVTATGAELTATETGTPYLIIETVGAAGATGASVAVARLGLLLAPDAAQAGGGLTWYDTSGNAANITLPASGVSWNVPSSSKVATGWAFGGSVGIGTTTPASLLDVFHATAAVADIHSNRENSGDTALLRFSTVSSTSSDYRKGGIFYKSDGTGFGRGDFVFALDSVEDSGSVAIGDALMTLKRSGNVLIGTTTDGGQKLQVSGTGLLSANLGGNGFVLNVNNVGGNAVLQLMGSTAASHLRTLTNGSLNLITGGTNGSLGTTALTLDSSQNATFAGTIAIYGASTADTLKITRASNTANGMLKFITTSTEDWIVGQQNTSDSDFHFYSYGISGDALKLERSTGNATFAGNVSATKSTGATILAKATSGVTAFTGLSLQNKLASGAGTTVFVIGAYDDNTTGAQIVASHDYSSASRATLSFGTRDNAGTLADALSFDVSRNATFAGKTYTAAGTAAAPAISFSGDTDSGFYNPGGNQVSLACGGGQIWNTTVNGLSMASGKDIYLGNAYQAATVVPTGYVTIKDSTGTVYKVCVLL